MQIPVGNFQPLKPYQALADGMYWVVISVVWPGNEWLTILLVTGRV